MRVRNETVETPRETGKHSCEEGRHTCNSMSTDRAASTPACMPKNSVQACRSGVSTVAVEAFMDYAG